VELGPSFEPIPLSSFRAGAAPRAMVEGTPMQGQVFVLPPAPSLTAA